MKRSMTLLFCIAFVLCLILPALHMELGTNVHSEIDNTYLPEFRLSPSALTSYVDKRIGFRNEALDLYQSLNDQLFGVMDHPTYMRGEEGHIFFKGQKYISNYQHLNLDAAGAETFAASLSGFQQYAQSQGMTFLYFLIPDKETIYPEYYPKTVNVYADISRTDQVIEALEKQNVHYYYAKDVMLQEKQVRDVNNVKFDAGHWNHHGAFISIQNLYTILRNDYPLLQPLERSEFNVTNVLKESLLTSRFEINEMVPEYSLTETAAIDETASFRETVKLSYPDHYVCHYKNSECREMPKLLVIGDSYLDGYDQFFLNHFSEYTYIHRYNIYNQDSFEYYVSQVNPDIVIFENPERSLIIDLNKPEPEIAE